MMRLESDRLSDLACSVRETIAKTTTTATEPSRTNTTKLLMLSSIASLLLEAYAHGDPPGRLIRCRVESNPTQPRLKPRRTFRLGFVVWGISDWLLTR